MYIPLSYLDLDFDLREEKDRGEGLRTSSNDSTIFIEVHTVTVHGNTVSPRGRGRNFSQIFS